MTKTADEISKTPFTLKGCIRSLRDHFRQNSLSLICAAIGLIYYSLLITDVRIGLRSFFGVVYMGQTFNSMLAHLLHGQFDVDPSAIGVEAFIRNGKTYAYFGIFTAMLRLPLLLAGKLSDIDITMPSCVLASCIAVYFKTAAISALKRTFGDGRFRSGLFWALILATVFGGPQIQFLKASIYQEVISWAAAIAAAYVYCAVYGLVIRRSFSTALLLCMTFLGGLELVNRVSTGLGLCASTGLLILTLAWQSRASKNDMNSSESGGLRAAGMAFAKSLITPRFVGCAAILLVAALICFGVNYGRWGNPFIFVPNHLKLDYDAPRIARLDQYGDLNIRRLWFGLLYYTLPVWTIIRSDGQFLFQPLQTRLIDELELPPSSFFISDPLLLFFVGCFFWQAFKFKKCGALDMQRVTLVLAGLTVPIWIVCMAIYLAFRYRVEFYPFLDLAGLLGLYVFLFYSAGTGDRLSRAVNRWVPCLCAVQIISSHILMLAYKVSPFGFRSDTVLSEGWLHFYSAALTEWLHRRFIS